MAFLPPVLTFVMVAVLIPLMIRLAPHLGLLDAPGGRKKHEGTVPLIGGLIIIPVFIIAASLSGFSPLDYWPLYTALALLLVTGAWDDSGELRAGIKFTVQFIAAALIIFPGEAQLHHLGDMFGFGKLGLDIIALPFTFAAVVLLINAVNLMDGLDGLAAGTTTIALGWLAVGFFMSGNAAEFHMTLILITALAGFLLYNLRTPFRRKAALFLGDAGSLCLGLTLAWFAIHAGAEALSGPALAPIAVAWILAIPIYDTCAQFNRRVREGRHPFSPDRGHLHHHFIDAGISDGYASALIIKLSMAFGAFGVLGLWLGIPQIVLTILWITGLFTHMWLSVKPARYVAFIRKVLPNRFRICKD